jgi:hypothetical protein
MDSDDFSKDGIGARIHLIRGASVMLDVDLAALYRVTPGALMQGVRRNRRRFPEDFLFQLTNQEVTGLKSQTVISKSRPGRGNSQWASDVIGGRPVKTRRSARCSHHRHRGVDSSDRGRTDQQPIATDWFHR